MKSFKSVLTVALVLGLGAVTPSAFAEVEAVVDTEIGFVQASPMMYDFGSVRGPGMRTAMITFINQSNEDIMNFNAMCSGDYSVFNCSSSCFMLRAYGSCTVTVYFQPRFGDGMRKSFNVTGSGSGAFAQATVWGIDAR